MYINVCECVCGVCITVHISAFNLETHFNKLFDVLINSLIICSTIYNTCIIIIGQNDSI